MSAQARPGRSSRERLLNLIRAATHGRQDLEYGAPPERLARGLRALQRVGEYDGRLGILGRHPMDLGLDEWLDLYKRADALDDAQAQLALGLLDAWHEGDLPREESPLRLALVSARLLAP